MEYIAFDTIPRKWQHLNIFQHTCYIHPYVPQPKLGSGLTIIISVSWARAGSHFTLLFEVGILLTKSEVTLRKVGEIIGDILRRVISQT